MPYGSSGPDSWYFSSEYPGMEDVLLHWNPPPAHQLIRVTVDTLISRVDIGPGATTRVNAGDHIPVELEALPRQPA